MLKYLVKGQNIELLEHEIIAADQISFVKVHFAFDNNWKPLHKVVQFCQDEDTFYRVLGIDGTSCLLPAELHPGTARMSLFGYDTVAPDTVRATTVVKTLNIRPSGFESGVSVPPSPDLYQQLIAQIEDMLKNHNCGGNGANGLSAYELAVQNGFRGTLAQWLESLKGKDGRDGIDGKDGKDGADGQDGRDGRDGVDGKDGRDGVDGKDGTNGSDSPPCDCESKIKQLEDRIEYDIHEVRDEFDSRMHDHSNFYILNKIKESDFHAHANKTVLDGITQAQINSWNGAVKALEGVETFLATLVEVN